MGAPVLYKIYGEERSQNGTIEDFMESGFSFLVGFFICLIIIGFEP